MSKEDDIYNYILNKLREITANLSETEKQQAKVIAEYMKLFKGDKDHEGKQTFPVEDYKRRN